MTIDELIALRSNRRAGGATGGHKGNQYTGGFCTSDEPSLEERLEVQQRYTELRAAKELWLAQGGNNKAVGTSGIREFFSVRRRQECILEEVT